MRSLRLPRGSRQVIALFVLMILLPAFAFGVLIVRGVRDERMRLEFEKSSDAVLADFRVRGANPVGFARRA